MQGGSHCRSRTQYTVQMDDNISLLSTANAPIRLSCKTCKVACYSQCAHAEYSLLSFALSVSHTHTQPLCVTETTLGITHSRLAE